MNPLISSAIYSAYADNPDKNVVFSPASYLEAIHSLLLCVKGENLRELLSALGMSNENLEEQIVRFRTQLNGLETYNCLLHAAEYLPYMECDVVEALHRIGSDLRDFTTLDSAIELVNRIVREKTHGKIDGLADRQSVNELTKFIILNCVYFKREWVHKFRENHYTEPFHTNNGPVSVRFMSELGNFAYHEDSSVDIVEIPYKGTDICCYLIVPKSVSLFDVIRNIAEHFKKISQVSHQLEVKLTVPPFKIESTFDLVESAENAGVKNLFSWNKDWRLVDFSQLLPETVLKVQKIKQKAFIDFTKDGTEAAAATMISIGISGCYINPNPPPVKIVRADKPFAFCLANRARPEIPLFFGIVNSLPSQSNLGIPHFSTVDLEQFKITFAPSNTNS